MRADPPPLDLPLSAAVSEIATLAGSVQARCRRNVVDPDALAREAHTALERAAMCGEALGIALDQLPLTGWFGTAPPDGSDVTVIVVSYGRITARRGACPSNMGGRGLLLRLTGDNSQGGS